MILGKGFENIDGGRYNSSFAIFDRLRQIHPVEQNVAELPGRADVELHASRFVDFFCLHADFAFEFCRHFGKRGGVDFYSGLLHARENWD